MSKWPSGVSTITLFVDDLDSTKRFYLNVFGLPVIFEDADSAVFNFGNMLVNLLRTTAAPELIEPAKVGVPGTGARFQLTIDVDDADATCAEVKRRGAELINGPTNRPWGVRTACFMDPAGHIWEVAATIAEDG